MFLFFRKYLASFLLVLLFLGLASFALAKDLEIVYPQFGDLKAPRTTQTLLPDYVKYGFNFAIGISSLVVFAVIFYSGFRLITEAQNPSAMSEAKTKITDAFIGLIILLGSYLFLTTINPQLALINPEIKGGNQGIILYSLDPSSSNFDVATNQKTITISQDLTKDFPSAKFYQFSTDPNFVKAWVDSKELVGQGCFEKACLLDLSSPKSIKIEYQFPGVYLCKADGSCYFTSRSFSEFPSNIIRDYEDKITSIKFKNAYAYEDISKEECGKKSGQMFDKDVQGVTLAKPVCGYPTLKFGAILHEGRDYALACDIFTANKDVVLPKIKDGGVSSVTVFVQPNEAPDPTKGGVILYKLENFTETQIQSDKSEKKIFKPFPYSPNLAEDYKDLGSYDDGTEVGDHVLSLKIDGNYMALLFQNTNFQHKCEVISADDFNLGIDNPVGKNVSSLKVIPTQK